MYNYKILYIYIYIHQTSLGGIPWFVFNTVEGEGLFQGARSSVYVQTRHFCLCTNKALPMFERNSKRIMVGLQWKKGKVTCGIV